MDKIKKKLGDWIFYIKKHKLFPWLYKFICDIIKEMRLNICPNLNLFLQNQALTESW